jgi:hypothetical protein
MKVFLSSAPLSEKAEKVLRDSDGGRDLLRAIAANGNAKSYKYRTSSGRFVDVSSSYSVSTVGADAKKKHRTG